MIRIFPSLIAADLLNLEREILVLDSCVDGYHIDIMDNHFVPNLTWGPLFVNAIAQATQKPLWIHVMVENPQTLINQFQISAESLITFHIETKENIKELIFLIKEKKWRVGIAINPKTAVEECVPYLNLIDQLLVMSVEPGFSGQLFNQEVLYKISLLVAAQKKQKRVFSIAMDGGINYGNIAQLYASGVKDFAIASGIFNYTDRVKAVHDLRLAVVAQ